MNVHGAVLSSVPTVYLVFSHSVRRRPLEKVLLDLEHFMEEKVPTGKIC